MAPSFLLAVSRKNQYSMPVKPFNLLRILILSMGCSFTLISLATAGEVTGTVHHLAGQYILLQTDTGSRVIRTDNTTAFGNLVGPGALKQGGAQVRVTYDVEVAGVALATAVTDESNYVPSAEQAAPIEQVAAELAGGRLLLVDSRSRNEWDAGRISGAVHYSGPEELARTSRDKGKRIIFYGSSAADLRPYTAARALRAIGLKEFRIFPGGIKEWRQQGKLVQASPIHLERLLARGSAFRVIDLRKPITAQLTLIEGTEQIPVTSMTRDRMFLPYRPFQMPLYLYGEAKDYAEALNRLIGWGYHQDGDITFLDETWKEWSGKFRSGGARPGTLPAGEIGYDEFRMLWNSPGPGKILLNVKPVRDRDAPAELHIPLEELPERINEIPRNKEIIIYCIVGLRSAVAQQILQHNGFTSRFLSRSFVLDNDNNPRQDLLP